VSNLITAFGACGQSSPATEASSEEGPSDDVRRAREEANHGRDPNHRPSPDSAGPHCDAATVTDAGGVGDSAAIADPRGIARSRRIATDGDGEMKISAGVRERSSGSAVPAGAADVSEQGAPSAEGAGLPFAGYDRLNERQLIQGLSDHTQSELEAVDNYERSHKSREAVFNKLRYLRGSEPLPGYDALGAEEIRAALEDADPQTIKKVRGYERKFRGRPRVLDEVVRIQRARRAAEPSRLVAAYRPASAGSGPNSAASVT
jgi:hypothetical protein